MKHSATIKWVVLGMLSLRVLVSPAQPAIVSTSPTANQTNAPRSSPVIVNFTQPLNTTSASALRLFSSQRGGLRLPASGTASVNGNQLQFSPSYDWKPGETVRGTVTTSVQNNSGQALAGPRVFEFTAATGGSGLGSFVQQGTFTVAAYPNHISLADVDGDGDLDMVSSNSSVWNGPPPPVSIRLNNGLGQFSGGSDVIVATSNNNGYRNNGNLNLADIDGDGDIDLITSNVTDSVSIRFNDGSGRFLTGQNLYVSGVTNISDLLLSDIDGDGDLDLLTYAFYQHNYDPMFTSLNVKYNTGNGQFVGGYSISIANNGGGCIRTADLDGDGDLDLIRSDDLFGAMYVHNNPGGTGVFSSTPTNTFPSTGVYSIFIDIEVGDVDRDGDLDLVTLDNNGAGGAYVWFNSVTGGFRSFAKIPLNGNPQDLSLGDLDADGDLDLVIVDNMSVACYFNNGQGAFGGYYRFVNSSVGIFALGDIDGDNDLDLVGQGRTRVPPVPPCTMYTCLNQATSPVLVLNTLSAMASQVALYPNPVQQQFEISLPELGRNAVITIVNAIGQTIRTIPVTDLTSKHSVLIDVADLTPGTYSVLIHAETGIIARQLVKE